MEAVSSVLVAGITGVFDVPFEESKREHSFRVEYLEKPKDSDEPPKPNSVVLSCATAAEFESWRDTLDTVRYHYAAFRAHEISREEGGEWGLVRQLARELLRATKGVLKNTVMMTGMLKNMRFGRGAAEAVAPIGLAAVADADRMRESVNLEFFHSAIGEMVVLFTKDTLRFLGSPFDATLFQNVSESAKQV
jgi:hypothetical protein